MENGLPCSQERQSFHPGKSLVIDSKNPQIMYIGMEGAGILKTTNGGISWKSINNGLRAYPDSENPGKYCYGDVGQMIIDPTDSDRILFARADTSTGTIYDPYSETAGVWESLDVGESWHQLLKDRMNAGGTGALAFDPTNPQIIYYGVDSTAPTISDPDPNWKTVYDGVFYKTVNGGETWDELPTGLLVGLQGIAIFVNPENSRHVLALTNSHDHAVSPDGSHLEVMLPVQFGPVVSRDGGASWSALAKNLPEKYRSIFGGDVSFNQFNHFFVKPLRFDEGSTYDDQKSFVTLDGGSTFHETPFYLDVARYDPHDASGNHLLGYTLVRNSLMESADGGLTWQELSPLPPGVRDAKVYVSHIVWHPDDSKTVFMIANYAYVWKSADGGKTWTNLLNVDKLPG